MFDWIRLLSKHQRLYTKQCFDSLWEECITTLNSPVFKKIII